MSQFIKSHNHPFPTKPDYERACKEGNFNSIVFLEKDFWTCWILEQIYHLVSETPFSKTNPRLIIKGSFSYSKAYKMNPREYADLDFIFARQDVGFTETLDELITWKEEKISDYRKDLFKYKADYVINYLYPKLLERCIKLFGDGWSLKTNKVFDPFITFDYPKILSGADYSKSDTEHWIQIDFDCTGESSLLEKYAEMKTINPYIYDSHKNTSFDFSVPCLNPIIGYQDKLLILSFYHNMSKEEVNKRIRLQTMRVADYFDIAYANKNHQLNQANNVIDMSLLELIIKSSKLFYKEFDRTTKLPNKNEPFKIMPPDGFYSSIKSIYDKKIKLVKGPLIDYDQTVSILEKFESKLNQSCT